MKKILKKIAKKALGAEQLTKVNLLRHQLIIAANRSIREIGAQIQGKQKSGLQHCRRFAASGGQTFFGYYDVSPFSRNNRMLLAMVAPFPNRTPGLNEKISVGYFNLNGNRGFTPIGKTSTWCWQMGCRLQWFPEDENDLILYNNIVNHDYGAIIQSVTSKSIVKTIDYPIYEIDRTGNWALSVNFSRLQRLRPGYGYGNLPDKTINQAAPQDDGIRLIDLSTGYSSLILTLEQISKIAPLPSMHDSEHYVNHLAFNPSGSRFMFFHLWTRGNQRQNRLMTCDRDGSNLRILENKGTVSHYAWKNETELLVTVYFKGIGFQYVLYFDGSDHHETLEPNILNADGHPSYSPDGKMILTDTYPDKYSERHLKLYHLNGATHVVHRFFSPPQMQGEVRCDLHPRWDSTGKYVCVDTSENERRCMYVFDIEQICGTLGSFGGDGF